MTNLFLIVIFFFSNIALSLHSENHHQTSPTYNEDQYLKGLQLRQTKLNDSMIKIKTIIDSLNQKLQQNNMTSDQQVTALQQAMAEERDALYNVEAYMKLPFNLKACNSSTLTTDQRNSLINQSKQLNQSLQTLKKQLVACANCTISASISQTIDRQQIYLRIINQVMESNCSKLPYKLPPQNQTGLVDISQSLYKNNLKSSNWIWGNTTEDIYKLQAFAAAIKYNLTDCPIEYPYVSSVTGQCFQCPVNLKYNLGKKTCQNCSDGSVYNITSNTCQSVCTVTQIYNPETKKCDQKGTDSKCPIETPVWNSVIKACQTCPSATPVYQININTCVPCPANSTWNPDLKQCLPSCPPNNVYNVSSKTCIPQVVCNSSKPILNPTTQVCEACLNNTLWNNVTKKCDPSCAAGTLYNSVTSFCDSVNPDKCTDLKPIWNSSSLTCQICPQTTPVWNKLLKKCEPCPAVTPVYDYNQSICVQKICDPGYKWNPFLLKCSIVTHNCTINQYYNFANESCLTKCEANHTYFPGNDSCACPPEKPMFNNVTRVCEQPSCTNGTQWNANLQKCSPLTKNCTSSQVYNFTTETCVDKCPHNVTYIPANDSCACPPESPVFNSTTRTCMDAPCPANTFWNKLLLKCSPTTSSVCTTSQRYNATLEKCIDKCEANHTYFPGNDTCSCTPQVPVFDPLTRVCVQPSCPNGTRWNKELLKCSPALQNCLAWQAYVFTQEKCVDKCEANHTYQSATDQCSCTLEKPMFDPVTRTCLVPPCPAGFKWNPQLFKCSPTDMNCTKWQNLNFTTEECINKCQVNQTYYPQNNTCSCPPDRPFYDKVVYLACVEPKCGNGSAWNKYKLKCSPLTANCSVWQTYNFTYEECINQCEVNHTYYTNNDTCSCFPEAPLFNPKTRTCIIPPCNQNYQWNTYLKKCSPLTKPCNPWQHYNFTTEACDKKCENNQTYYPETDTCQCPPQFPIYNRATRVCEQPKCESSTQWNKYLLKCSPVRQACSIQQYYDFSSQLCVTRCETNHAYIQINDTCTCFPEKPLFNLTSRVCQEPPCPAGEKWNPNLKKCSPLDKKCQVWQKYNFNDQNCFNVCQEPQTYFPGNDTCSCTPLLPVFDIKTRKCIEPTCPAGQIWNKTLIVCAKPWTPPTCADPNMYYQSAGSVGCVCKTGFQYYDIYKSCKPICKTGQFLSSVSMLCEPIKVQLTCPKNMFLSQDGTQCNCLAGFIPDTTGTGCRVNCNAGFTYNSATGTCVAVTCQPGYSYNIAINQCTPIVITCPAGSYLNKAKMTCETCQSGFTYNTATNLCQAPLTTICPAGYVLNSTSKLCELPASNCSSGQYYNVVTKSCMVLYTTSPQAANLVTNNMSTYTTNYVQAKTTNPKLQDCVSPAPYYDPVSKTCVKCPTAQPYFNLDTSKCQDCGSSVYNSSSFACVAGPQATYKLDPTIGRFVSNVF